jgi:hypothetical protein
MNKEVRAMMIATSPPIADPTMTSIRGDARGDVEVRKAVMMGVTTWQIYQYIRNVWLIRIAQQTHEHKLGH